MYVCKYVCTTMELNGSSLFGSVCYEWVGDGRQRRCLSRPPRRPFWCYLYKYSTILSHMFSLPR